MTDTKQLTALVRLVDDDSPSVREAVLKELLTFGDLEQDLRNLTKLDAPRMRLILDMVERYRRDGTTDGPRKATSRKKARSRRAAPRRGPAGDPQPLFEVGQIVRHKQYGYRGVIVDLDDCCRADDGWYMSNNTQPGRDQPWYHVLVHDSDQVTYAAESNLTPDEAQEGVRHPAVPYYFSGFDDGRYERNDREWPGWDA